MKHVCVTLLFLACKRSRKPRRELHHQSKLIKEKTIVEIITIPTEVTATLNAINTKHSSFP